MAHQDLRTKEQRRKRCRRWLRRCERIALAILGWCAGVGCLFGGYLAVMMLPLFAIQEIAVQGDLRVLSPDAVRALAAVRAGQNLFQTPVAEVQRRIGEHPWVGEVAVRRKLPHTLWIYVGERTPAALLNVHGLYLVDEMGTVFKPWAPTDPGDLPVLSGVTDVKVGDDGLGRSAHVATLLQSKEIYERTAVAEILGCSELILDHYQQVSLITEQPALYLRLGPAPDPQQLERLYHILPAVRAQGTPRAIDVSVEGKIIVRYSS